MKRCSDSFISQTWLALAELHVLGYGPWGPDSQSPLVGDPHRLPKLITHWPISSEASTPLRLQTPPLSWYNYKGGRGKNPNLPEIQAVLINYQDKIPKAFGSCYWLSPRNRIHSKPKSTWLKYKSLIHEIYECPIILLTETISVLRDLLTKGTLRPSSGKTQNYWSTS